MHIITRMQFFKLFKRVEYRYFVKRDKKAFIPSARVLREQIKAIVQ